MTNSQYFSAIKMNFSHFIDFLNKTIHNMEQLRFLFTIAVLLASVIITIAQYLIQGTSIF